MDGLGLSIEVALGFIEDVESLENYGPCWAVDQWNLPSTWTHDLPMEQWKKGPLVGLGWFRYVGDEQLPSFVGW